MSLQSEPLTTLTRVTATTELNNALRMLVTSLLSSWRMSQFLADFVFQAVGFFLFLMPI